MIFVYALIELKYWLRRFYATHYR